MVLATRAPFKISSAEKVLEIFRQGTFPNKLAMIVSIPENCHFTIHNIPFGVFSLKV